MIVFVGRQDLRFSDIDFILVQSVALLYDREVYNVHDEERKYPSKNAMCQMTNKTFVLSVTTSTAASQAFVDMKAKFSINTIDEATHCTEKDSMSSFIVTAQQSQAGRLHGFQICDHNQLPPVYMSEHDIS